MNIEQLWMWLLATGLISVVAMTIGAGGPNQALVILAGAMFAVVAVVVAWRFAALTKPGDDIDAVAARFARLMAVAWGWAGAAMITCYYLTDLGWQHAWQYGAAMVLIAIFASGYARARCAPGSRFAEDNMAIAAQWLTRLQGLAALAGVTILALSGKLEAGKQDWAANVVFVVGGLMIFALSMAALRAEQRAKG